MGDTFLVGQPWLEVNAVRLPNGSYSSISSSELCQQRSPPWHLAVEVVVMLLMEVFQSCLPASSCLRLNGAGQHISNILTPFHSCCYKSFMTSYYTPKCWMLLWYNLYRVMQDLYPQQQELKPALWLMALPTTTKRRQARRIEGGGLQRGAF